MKYKRSRVEGYTIFFFFLVMGLGMFFVSFTRENKMEIYFGSFVASPFIIFGGILLFQLWRNFTIIVEDEFITMIDGDIKFGTWRLSKPIFIQIKLEDVIAIYSIRKGVTKNFFVVPKAHTGDDQCDETINRAIKIGKKEKVVKAYIDWLIVHKKGIKIPKEIEDYRNLLREIYKKAPLSILDNETKRLLE